MGIVSAPLHPAAAKAVSLGIPPARRTWANGMVTAAALLGVTATYVVFSRLIDINWLDWPGAFFVAALATAAVGWLWSRWSIREPGRDFTAGESTENAPTENKTVVSYGTGNAWSVLRRNKNLLLLTASYGAAGYLQYLFFYWMHYYFEHILRLDVEQSRYGSAAATLAMAVGMALGGWLSDRLELVFGWRIARAGLAIGAMTASSCLVLVGIHSTEQLATVSWLILSMGVLGLAEGPFWVTAVEVGGPRGGLSASIFNTGGNAGGFLAPVITPWLSDTLQLGWQIGISAGSLVCLLGGILWYWIDISPQGQDVSETQDGRFP